MNDKNLAEIILAGKIEELGYIHRGLIRALEFIHANFKEDISLSDIARESFVSSSHLSYLFRLSLNTTYKAVITNVRIEYAKQLIEESPSIKLTNLCFESGFGDLSHFEKMFRRYVGMPPRQYRQKIRDKN